MGSEASKVGGMAAVPQAFSQEIRGIGDPEQSGTEICLLTAPPPAARRLLWGSGRRLRPGPGPCMAPLEGCRRGGSVVSSGHSFEGGAHRSSGQIEWFLQGIWTQRLFPPSERWARLRAALGWSWAGAGPELGGGKVSLSTCRFPSRVVRARGGTG